MFFFPLPLSTPVLPDCLLPGLKLKVFLVVRERPGGLGVTNRRVMREPSVKIKNDQQGERRHLCGSKDGNINQSAACACMQDVFFSSGVGVAEKSA